MKVLIADSDRDFLMSFKKLLELSSYEASTVFDATQLVMQLPSGYDLVILEQALPRLDSRDVIKLLNEEQVPVIVILEKKVNEKILMDEVLANAYLSLPFFPSELIAAAEGVIQNHTEGGVLALGDGMEIDMRQSKLCGKLRVTSEEIRILKAVYQGESLFEKNIGPYIHSLNNKLAALNKEARIQYVIREGYRLVVNHE